jgi:energy-coupling factor transporter ATP-binding protein EcfA2
LIKIKNLTYNYKNESKNIFENAELTIAKGMWLLQGDNGVGKSTLLKILNNTYSYEGEISDTAVVEVKGSMIFLDDKTSLPLNLHELDIAKYIFKINDILLDAEYVPLYTNKALVMYSVGERKMATLKILSYLKIDILIIDEYITNIDETNMVEVFNILKNLDHSGTIIIISSNEVDIKSRFPNRIVIKNEKLEVIEGE